MRTLRFTSIFVAVVTVFGVSAGRIEAAQTPLADEPPVSYWIYKTRLTPAAGISATGTSKVTLRFSDDGRQMQYILATAELAATGTAASLRCGSRGQDGAVVVSFAKSKVASFEGSVLSDSLLPTALECAEPLLTIDDVHAAVRQGSLYVEVVDTEGVPILRGQIEPLAAAPAAGDAVAYQREHYSLAANNTSYYDDLGTELVRSGGRVDQYDQSFIERIMVELGGRK